MDESGNQMGTGSGPQGSTPVGTVVPMPDGWAAGVSPVAISPRSRRFRWGVAGSIVMIVALATTAGAFVLSGAGSKSLTAVMAPKNSIYFMEVRTDLPGDQRTKLSDFMSHFPGFKDRSQFDNALDEMFNKLTGAVSQDLQYTSAFKPWIEGEVSIAVTSDGSVTGSNSLSCGDLRNAMGSFGPGMAMASFDPNMFSFDPNASFENMTLFSFDPRMFSFDPNATFPGMNQGGLAMTGISGYTAPSAVAIVALKDRAAAQTWVTGELTRLKVTTTSAEYAGTQVYSTGSGLDQGAYAFTDQALLLGTVDGVKAALDTKTKGSLADNPNYQAAMKATSADSLTRFYVDLRSYERSLVDGLNALSCVMAPSGATPAPAFDPAKIPAWLAGSLRAESDHMVLEMALPNPGTLSLGNHASRIASSLPESTVGVFEMHSIGQTVTSGISALQSEAPKYGLDTSSIKKVTDALAIVGGLDWIGDGTAVVTKDGASFGGGIVVEAKDAATAQSKVDLAGNLIALSGVATGLKSRAETYNGHAITIVTVPSGSGLPSVDVAFAVKDNLIVVGYTDAFVKSVLDTTSSASLASQPDYSAAMAAAGNSNEESAYINVPALEDQIGLAALSANSSRWTLDYKPYFDHMGGIAYSVIDGNTVILRLVVTAR